MWKIQIKTLLTFISPSNFVCQMRFPFLLFSNLRNANDCSGLYGVRCTVDSGHCIIRIHDIEAIRKFEWRKEWQWINIHWYHIQPNRFAVIAVAAHTHTHARPNGNCCLMISSVLLFLPLSASIGGARLPTMPMTKTFKTALVLSPSFPYARRKIPFSKFMWTYASVGARTRVFVCARQHVAQRLRWGFCAQKWLDYLKICNSMGNGSCRSCWKSFTYDGFRIIWMGHFDSSDFSSIPPSPPPLPASLWIRLLSV